MGILRQGLFGGFEKKTGGLIGRKVAGKNVVSALQHKTDQVRTAAQLDQQMKFELVVSVLRWFADFIAIGFRDTWGKKKAMAMALKYNFKRIIVGESPAYAIDYSRLVYSKGSLSSPHHPMISRVADELEISWLPEVQTRYSRSTDKANFVIYCPDKELIIKYRNKTTRAALGSVLSLPPGLDDAMLHVWMSFVATDGKMVSDSVYLGTI